jgi:hypothetical protein
VPPAVIEDYKRRYGTVTHISHPAETNGLEPIRVYQEPEAPREPQGTPPH